MRSFSTTSKEANIARLTGRLGNQLLCKGWRFWFLHEVTLCDLQIVILGLGDMCIFLNVSIIVKASTTQEKNLEWGNIYKKI